LNRDERVVHIAKRLYLSIDPELLAIDSSEKTLADALIHQKAVLHSNARSAALQRLRWTPEEDATVLDMKGDGCLWEGIYTALPHRAKEAIWVRSSTKLKEQYC
jgi:hypothetical protein